MPNQSSPQPSLFESAFTWGRTPLQSKGMWTESTHYRTWFYYQDDLDCIRFNVNQQCRALSEQGKSLESQPETQPEETEQRYRKTSVIGSGAFGVVYKAVDTDDNDRVVAIKAAKRRGGDQGDCIPTSMLREIKLLKELQHPNITSLVDVVEHNATLRLVLEYAETDLSQIIADQSVCFRLSNIKAYGMMILRGLDYLHQRWILHRDLKPANLLVTADGVVKIADFGLSKNFGLPQQYMTPCVVTRWYRSPELLMAADDYGVGVDMWAVGCIMAELVQRFPFFHAAQDSDLEQLVTIYEKMGSPSVSNWPAMTSLRGYIQIKRRFPGKPLEQLLPIATPEMLHLLRQLLKYDPRQRADCSSALNMKFFSQPPTAKLGSFLPLNCTASISDEMDWTARNSSPQQQRASLLTCGVKRKSTEKSKKSSKKPKMVKTISAGQEKQLVSHYETFLCDLARSFTPPIPLSVVWTALNYMKRFYLTKSVMERHPKDMAPACLYLATRVDEYHISVGRFLLTLSSRNLPTTRSELHANQLIVMRHIYYHLVLHTPFRCIEEFLTNVECDRPDYSSKLLQNAIGHFLLKFIHTDGVFVHSPVRIGLAAILHAAKTLGDRVVEKYLDDNLARDMDLPTRCNLKKTLDKIIALIDGS